MMRMLCTSALLALAGLASAATVEVYWDITWVRASPDGYSRPVIGINGVWPCPKLEATVGDTVIVHVDNKLGNETTGMHWHGISQKGTAEMDGAVAGTQCSIPPGKSATYKFLVCDTARFPKPLRSTEADSSRCRLISRGHIGIIHTRWDNTLTVFGALL